MRNLISVSTDMLSSEYTAAGEAQAQEATIENVKTLRLKVDPNHLETDESENALRQAAQILRAGGLVALPTETVYGLGASALDQAAVEKIFLAKQRPAWDPIIVHIVGEDCGKAMLGELVTDVPEAARKLMEAFWPGPLTLLLPRSAAVPDVVTASRPLVGVRMPAHPVALALIRRAGVPVAAPSANIFGHTSPTTAAHVLQDLDGRIDAVLDAGPTRHGIESTVLDPCQSPMVIYRPGAVEVFSSSQPLGDTPQSALPSPGVGLRHYAPRARLVLVEAPSLQSLAAGMAEAAQRWPAERIGVMLPAEVSCAIEGSIQFPLGRWSVPEELARGLYDGLRFLDSQGCTVILCPVPPGPGISEAIRDRLRKAASR